MDARILKLRTCYLLNLLTLYSIQIFMYKYNEVFCQQCLILCLNLFQLLTAAIQGNHNKYPNTHKMSMATLETELCVL